MSAFTYTASRGVDVPASAVGAWLADTTAETLVGGELITNGGFPADVSGWTAGASVNLTHDATGGGRAQITSATTSNIYAYQGVTTVVGQVYRVSCDIVFGSGADVALLRAGNSTDNAGELASVSRASTGALSATFTATATTTYIKVLIGNQSGDVGYFDNMACLAVVLDVSSASNHLNVYGSITKAAVATGAQAVGYSGYSSSNYLQQPYNSGLDFSTGDFSFQLWFKGSVAGRVLLEREDIAEDGTGGTGTAKRIYVFGAGGGEISLQLGNGTAATSAAAPSTTDWHHVIAQRSSGVLQLFIDGALAATQSDSADLTDSGQTHVLRIGTGINYPSSQFNGQIALVKASTASFTAAQAKSLYDSERFMFRPYAHYTVSGSSYSIDVALSALTRSGQAVRNRSVSLSGASQTLVHRRETLWDIASALRNARTEMPELRELLYALQGGQAVTFDPYGTVASTDDPVSVVLEDDSYTEQRSGVTDYVRVGMRLREV